MQEKIYAMWLSDAIGPGSIHAKNLIEKYKSFSEIYRLGRDEYLEAGIKNGTKMLDRLLNKDTALCEKNFSFCQYNHFGVIEYTSHEYPKRLRNIKDAPPVLYTRGRMIDFDDNVCIAVVGTRSYTDAGWNATYKISGGLAKCGAVVVTGLASGIDTAATKAALETCGFAVGVIGSGLERIYPSENTALFEKMYNCGLIISELAPFSGITGKYFPVRNRIISGLCQGVLVGEGEERSGAMITAAHASEQGRRIFAIPGDINSSESSGVNRLIREGATATFDAWDILDKYQYLYPHKIRKVKDTLVDEVPEERSSKKIRFVSSRAKSVQNESDENKSKLKTEIPVPDVPQSEESIKRTEEALACLDDADRKVYRALSTDTPLVPDMISVCDMDSGKILTSLTMLELNGLCERRGSGFVKKIIN